MLLILKSNPGHEPYVFPLDNVYATCETAEAALKNRASETPTLNDIERNGFDETSRLRDFKFNDLPIRRLSIFVGKQEVAKGDVGEVLRQIPHLANHYIESTKENYYFNTLAIRLKQPE